MPTDTKPRPAPHPRTPRRLRPDRPGSGLSNCTPHTQRPGLGFGKPVAACLVTHGPRHPGTQPHRPHPTLALPQSSCRAHSTQSARVQPQYPHRRPQKPRTEPSYSTGATAAPRPEQAAQSAQRVSHQAALAALTTVATAPSGSSSSGPHLSQPAPAVMHTSEHAHPSTCVLAHPSNHRPHLQNSRTHPSLPARRAAATRRAPTARSSRQISHRPGLAVPTRYHRVNTFSDLIQKLTKCPHGDTPKNPLAPPCFILSKICSPEAPRTARFPAP